MPGWTYLILSERGEVYLGATNNLRVRLRDHNSPENTGWTRGRRWHLLDVRQFPTVREAFYYESMLKKKPHQKIKWKLATIPQAKKIQQKFDYAFEPLDWPSRHSRREKQSSQSSNTKSRLAKQLGG